MGAHVREQGSVASDRASVDALVAQIGRLVRHRQFARTRVVSAMLLRYIPTDVGYAWNGEKALHARLMKAGLDRTTLEHLTLGARREIASMKELNCD